MEEKKTTVVEPVVLELEEDGKHYTLDFDRASVMFAESKGFVVSEMSDKPFTRIQELFYFAFRKNHKEVSRVETDRIIDEYFGGVINIPPELIERLAGLYLKPYSTLSEGKNLKKVTIKY